MLPTVGTPATGGTKATANQGWAKLVSNLTFSKRKAMVFFEN
jgi:hypothetical protein